MDTPEGRALDAEALSRTYVWESRLLLSYLVYPRLGDEPGQFAI